MERGALANGRNALRWDDGPEMGNVSLTFLFCVFTDRENGNFDISQITPNNMRFINLPLKFLQKPNRTSKEAPVLVC